MKPLPLATRALLARLPAHYDRELCEVMARLALWRYARPDTPEALVLRIARCAVLDELILQNGGRRTSARAQGLRLTYSYDVSPDARDWHEETIPDPGADFRGGAEARLLLAHLLPRLTARQRAALALVDLQGLTYAEAGRVLGSDKKSVFDARQRALRDLRRWCEAGEYAAHTEGAP